MAHRKLKSSDVCEISGYERADLSALLRTMPPYCDAPTSARVARTFRAADLLLLCITRTLEDEFGLRRAAVSSVGKHLFDVLSVPRLPNTSARLIIRVEPPSVIYDTSDKAVAHGIVVALGPIFSKVDSYLIGDMYPSLRFGLDLVHEAQDSDAQRRQA